LRSTRASTFWSEWTVSDSPAVEAEAEKVRLIDDRRSVRALWVTAAQEKLALGASEAAAALCSSRTDLAAAISAEATESARAPSNLANRLHDRLIATLRLAQDSSNAEVRAGASTP
jgi:hypothetical protein